MRVLALLSFLFSLQSHGHKIAPQSSVLTHIHVTDETTSTVSEESFYRHFWGPYQMYASELVSVLPPLLPGPNWEQPYFTAYTAVSEGFTKMGFWGGLARIPGMNDNGVALITCHELGHILGGAPYFQLEHYKNFSNEGQADYFATKTCLKKYFRTLPTTLNYLEDEPARPYAVQCQKRFATPLDLAICLRMMSGIQAFAYMVGTVFHKQGVPSFDKKDNTKVRETIQNAYPSNQCRLDTLVAGALNLDRPRCWFLR